MLEQDHTVEQITLTQPDDWHIHLRDGEVLPYTVAAVSGCYRRCIVMPNLVEPVTTLQQALAYRQRIMNAVDVADSTFSPLMTLYIVPDLPLNTVKEVAEHPDVAALKYYPKGATTHSDSGIYLIEQCYPLLAEMEKQDVPLLIHGEVVSTEVDIFDREKIFVDKHLRPLVEMFPKLRIVLEHITTAEAVDFVNESSEYVAATITPQHLLFNRNHMLVGGVNPHLYCLPILKRNQHQQALLRAATSGRSKFFLGTDSAPHSRKHKESICGCAGCYNSEYSLALYAQAFASVGAIDKLEGFSSHYGADFYGLPRNAEKVQLVKQKNIVPNILPFGEEEVVPLCAGMELDWQFYKYK